MKIKPRNAHTICAHKVAIFPEDGLKIGRPEFS